jgi:hypothetical protein
MAAQCDEVTYSDDGKRVIRCAKDESPAHRDHVGYDPKGGAEKRWTTGGVTPIR